MPKTESGLTLQVCDHHFAIVGASEQVVSTWGETDWPHIAAVRSVRLHRPASFDVIQHAAAILMTGG